jgi:hypothetical protein
LRPPAAGHLLILDLDTEPTEPQTTYVVTLQRHLA